MLFLRENYIDIGKVLKTFKADGTLKASSYFDLPGLPPFGDFIFIEIDKKPVPFFIEQFHVIDDRIIMLKLEDVDTKDEAKPLISKSILIPRSILNTDHPAFYISGITGYSIKDENSGIKGKITALLENRDHNVLEVNTDKGVFLLPFHEDFIVNTDHEKKIITMKLPDGLLNN